MTEFLSLETSDPRPRQPTVTDPGVLVAPGVTPRHPPEELSVVDDKVRERELVRVEQEGRDGERKDGDPEVDEPVDPETRRHVEHHERQPETHVNGRPGETRVEDGKVDSGGGEPSSGRNVSSTSERQVGQDGLGVDLGREHLEHGREGSEMFTETNKSPTSSTFRQFCGVSICQRQLSKSEKQTKRGNSP